LVESKLKSYSGYELKRVDDRTGKTDVPLSTRTNKANEWGADIYLSVHHNAGINGGKGGGIIAIVYTNASDTSKLYQKIIYNELINKTGLKGNRANPMPTQNLHVCRETKMPAVLMECGFMDSTVDVPIILSEEYADKIAKAFAEVIIQKSGATKKVVEPSVIYRVQVGAYSKKENATNMANKLKAEGYDAIVVEYECEEGVIEKPKKEEPAPEPPKPEIKVGSNVKVKQGAKNYTGGGLASFVYTRVHQVKQLKGDRAVITYGGVTVCAIHKDNLILV
jgi:N-acetylmuramoyl-L-alanine amidase